ncbi:hypothetical protein D9M69_534190 [compost metagenome]
MAGTLARNMPISPPGMFLSQPPMTSTPSIHWPCTQVSMQSAITSRLTSEYFMPSVPIAMPSEMVGVPNTWALPPASSMPAMAASASFCRPELQGVMVLWPFATPTMGLTKSPSS